MLVADIAVRAALGAIAGALRELPRNGVAWTYTIDGYDATPYITRTLLPRVAGRRVVIHQIHRYDSDRWMHNHPWRTAAFMVAAGGYMEDRIVGGEVVRRTLSPGDVNRLDAHDRHRVVSVLPGTWTIGIVGDRCQDWGFFVDDEGFVAHADYFARRAYISNGPGAT